MGALGALLLGSAIGALAGFNRGRVDDLLMGAASLVLVLPAIYVVMVLRGAMPLVLSTSRVFWTLASVLALAGWPYPARGVRAIVAARTRPRVRRGCARAWGESVANPATSPAPRNQGAPRSAADAAAAGVHPGRGDAFVRGVRVCGTHTKLGSYAPGRGPGRRPCRCAMAAGPGRRDRDVGVIPPPGRWKPFHVALDARTKLVSLCSAAICGHYNDGESVCRSGTPDRSFFHPQSAQPAKCAERLFHNGAVQREKQFCIPPASIV